MSLGTRFLVLVAPAILPAIDPDERDFYQILGVSRNASSDDIKKSYRAKSLALHPDKIAQRNKSAEEAKAAAAEYELVQEAYNVLNDPKQRQTFDGVQCSVARFRFLQSGQAVNPTALHENLAASSVADKTRLVSVAVLLCFLFLFQPILIAAKVNAIVSNSTSSSMYGVKWTVLLIPWWLVQIVVLLMNFALFFLEAKVMRVVPVVVGHIFWFIGCIVLARAWDSPPDNWHAVAVPFYFWIVSNLVAALVDIREVGVEIDKMVSPEKLQDLAGSEATEEDLVELAQQYTVITVVPVELAAAIQLSKFTNGTWLTNEEIENLKVAMSSEYDMNQKLLKSLYGQIIKSLVVDLPLLILIALRVDGQISASWWVVFFPLLIFIVVKLFQSCFVFLPDPEAVFQLVMVCLIIGKLDSAVDGEEGYNTFWILFPVFLVTGIVLCCCSCLIYGASLDAKMPTTEEGVEEDDSNNGASGESYVPIVIPTPTPSSTNEEAPPDVETPPAQETHPESVDADNIPVQPLQPAEPEEDLNYVFGAYERMS